MGKKIELTEEAAGSVLNLLRAGVYPTVNFANVEYVHNLLLGAIRAAGLDVFPVEVPPEDHDDAVLNPEMAE